MNAYAETSDSKYMSNENRMIYKLQNVEILISSNRENEKVKYGEEIEYEVKIKNIGTDAPEYRRKNNYVMIRVLDFLPKEFEPSNIEYNNWKIVEIEKEESIGHEMQKEDITQDISGEYIDEDGNKKANVDIELIIPQYETVIVKVKGTAGMVYKETLVENRVMVTGYEVPDKISNIVSYTILPYDYEEPENPENPEDPNNPTPEEPDNPTPDDPNNPDIPEIPVVPNEPVTPSNPETPSINNGQIQNGNCDFKIDKYISKVTVKTVSGTKEYNYNNEKLVKTEIKAKEINGATVTVEYRIVATNVGQVAGIVTRVTDNLPNGFAITNESNRNWPRDSKGEYINTSKANLKIEPGESTTFTISATKQMTSETVGDFINEASIKNAMSVSGQTETNSGNNTSSAELIIAISTGTYVYISIAILTVVILVILAIYLAKKGKLHIGKFGKISLFCALFMIVISTQSLQAYVEYNGSYYFWYEYEGLDWWYGGPYDTKPGDEEIKNFCDNYLIASTAGNWGYSYNRYEINSSNFEKTIKDVILQKNGSSSVEVTRKDGIFRYGPFSYTSSNANSFEVEITDGKGNRIDGWAIDETMTNRNKDVLYKNSRE